MRGGFCRAAAATRPGSAEQLGTGFFERSFVQIEGSEVVLSGIVIGAEEGPALERGDA